MPSQPRRKSLVALALAIPSQQRTLSDERDTVILSGLQTSSCFRDPVCPCRGSILLATTRQLPTVLAAIELDGVAQRILLATPDLLPHLPSVCAEAQVDAIVSDGSLDLGSLGVPLIECQSLIVPHGATTLDRHVETEWVLFTSGTTGRPKMVVHTLSSLSGPLNDGVAVTSGAIWSTFYDIRRYGGLQILLRALLGGGSMVLSAAYEPLSDFLTRLAAAGITHISGTPTHWRRALMAPEIGALSPSYVRLSGEVADQGILDQLQRAFPQANIAHAFASTEAGVGFDVRDGLAGFPEPFLANPPHAGVELRVKDGTLRIRSSRTASHYIGQPLSRSDGFIDTGDLVERRGNRFYFLGRKEGVINVGGQKVFPEEVEAVITQNPDVLVARVWARPNPITGALVAADIVVRPDTAPDWSTLCAGLSQACRAALLPYKVPVSWRRVASIEMTAAGKIRRA